MPRAGGPLEAAYGPLPAKQVLDRVEHSGPCCAHARRAVGRLAQFGAVKAHSADCPACGGMDLPS